MCTFLHVLRSSKILNTILNVFVSTMESLETWKQEKTMQHFTRHYCCNRSDRSFVMNAANTIHTHTETYIYEIPCNVYVYIFL